MKKVFLLFFALFMINSIALATDETPASLHTKILEQSFVNKFNSLIIDKEIFSTQMPKGMTLKSKTFLSGDKFREESITKDPEGNISNITMIFTKDDTYLSYNTGEVFYALGTSFMDKISSTLKNIEPFSDSAKLLEKTEKINGRKCYVVEDIIEGVKTVFYIDKENFLLLKSIASSAGMIIDTELSDYKKVDKFMTPYTTKVSVKQNGREMISKIKITSIEFNPKISEDLFVPKNVMSFPKIPGFDIKSLVESLF